MGSPWEDLDEGAGAGFEAELDRELSAGHPLRGARAVARSSVCDDVAFRDASGQLFIVHLTWRGREEQPGWPSIERVDTLEDDEEA